MRPLRRKSSILGQAEDFIKDTGKLCIPDYPFKTLIPLRPSETTNICTVNPRVSPDDSINNIGRPFKNTSAFVLSPGPNFSLVPRGGEGEFCFGGSQVFHGYMNKEQEMGKIIEHPKFGRLYRSGDFGRLMPDGTLAFTGRKDDQVKIRVSSQATFISFPIFSAPETYLRSNNSKFHG